MSRKIFLSVILLCLILPSVAQNKYWVFFTDKKDVAFDPYSYFDKKAIQRRERCHLPLFDSTDMPVKDQYIQAVQNLSDSVGYSTRWFNAVVAWMQPDQKMKVESLPFVSSVEQMDGVSNVCSVQSWDTTLNSWQSQILNRQTESMQASLFKQKGIDGKGVRIAIFDAGFPTVDVNPAFEKIRNEGRILNTWDFVHNKKFVYAYNAHGTNTFSCIAGMIGDKQIGLATGAEFILARTERSGEPYSEEQNWLAAVEWADKNGADIVNSSLGYTYHRYFPWDMDGKKSLVTRAGNLAARKGILIVNAAGNDGDNQWHVMGAPADADSVLTVGGIDPNGEYHTDFSSYGPTADLRMKPNVCAYGHVIASGKNGLNKTQGTS
ncbi:MAG: S8 family serine peptidase, partial [Bacteroidota bacterium]